MKKTKILLLLTFIASGLILTNCKNDDEGDPDPGPGCTNVVTQEAITYGGTSSGTETRVYTYSSGKLVKVTYAYNGGSVTQYDTVIYAGGLIDSINSFTVGNATPNETRDFTWASGKLDYIIEKGDNGAAYTRTRDYVYSGDNITKERLTYSVGAKESGDIDSISNITFTSGNITSATIHAQGEAFDGQNVVATYETTAPNPYKGLFIQGDNPLINFSANNATSAVVGGVLTLETKSYTYSDGRVATINSSDPGGHTEATTLTYECK